MQEEEKGEKSLAHRKKNYSFPKASRITERKAIRQLFSEGCIKRSNLFIVRYSKHRLGEDNFFLLCPAKKQLKLACHRNLWKRRLREIIRRNPYLFIGGFYISIGISKRNSEPLCSFQEFQNDLLSLLNKILKQNI